MAAAVMGYKMILVMPENQSIERRQTMLAYGAELILTSKEGSMELARDTAEKLQAEESKKQEKALVAQGFHRTIDLFHGLANWEPDRLLEVIEDEESSSLASRTNQEEEAILLAINMLTSIHKAKYAK